MFNIRGILHRGTLACSPSIAYVHEPWEQTMTHKLQCCASEYGNTCHTNEVSVIPWWHQIACSIAEVLACRVLLVHLSHICITVVALCLMWAAISRKKSNLMLAVLQSCLNSVSYLCDFEYDYLLIV